MTRLSCDVLVVGGGPAGLVAGREIVAAAPALDVVLLERDPSIGSPVRCGEGVGARGVAEFLDPAGAQWISRRITRVRLRSPDGCDVTLAEGDVGYILDRTRFEGALAAEASRAGAELRVGTEAIGMRPDGEGWIVSTHGPSGVAEVRARLVIGADGVESLVGRWAGLDTRVPARDMESCAQYLLSNVEIDPDAISLHFGDRVAPGGYAWVFPKGVDVANVGVGVIAVKSRGRSARGWLDDFVGAQFPTGTRLGCTVGGVIVSCTTRQTVANGVLLCGDAAHMINPLSGGGIVNAMKAGRLAARTAVAALAARDTSARALAGYHESWMRLLGDDHVRFYRVKEALNRFDDAFLDRLARTLNAVPRERRTLGRAFAAALVHNPSLLPVIARYFA